MTAQLGQTIASLVDINISIDSTSQVIPWLLWSSFNYWIGRHKVRLQLDRERLRICSVQLKRGCPSFAQIGAKIQDTAILTASSIVKIAPTRNVLTHQ